MHLVQSLTSFEISMSSPSLLHCTVTLGCPFAVQLSTMLYPSLVCTQSWGLVVNCGLLELEVLEVWFTRGRLSPKLMSLYSTQWLRFWDFESERLLTVLSEVVSGDEVSVEAGRTLTLMDFLASPALFFTIQVYRALSDLVTEVISREPVPFIE